MFLDSPHLVSGYYGTIVKRFSGQIFNEEHKYAITREFRVEDRRQNLGYGLLDHPVGDGRNSQLAGTAIRFFNFHTSDRCGLVPSCFQLGGNLSPVAGFCPCGKFINGHPIDARGSLVGSNTLPCRVQIIPLQHAFEQVVAKGWLRVTTLGHAFTGRCS